MYDLKNHRRGATGGATLSYPVELVWHALTGSSDPTQIKPMDEDEFNNTVPGKGEIYTRHLQSKLNKLMSFEMKTPFSSTVWRIELVSLGPSTTRITCTNTTSYTGDKQLFKMVFAPSPAMEIRALIGDIKYRLKMDDVERSRRLNEFNNAKRR